MFQEIIIEIIKRIENLTKEKRSIVELDIADIKNQIQELLFKIDFTPNTIEDIDFRKIKKLEVTPKEALGLLFLSFTTTLRSELSYGSLWLDIVEVLTEFEEEEDKNSFFADHYIEDSEPTDYLNEAIKDAVIRFNLRDGYDTSRPTYTVLLQMGILNIFKNINYWLTSTSKNSIIQELTNRSSQNFSTTFNSGWKVLQRHSQSLISKEDATTFLESNIWFKDFDIDELLKSSKEKLSTTLISVDNIENSFFLDSVKYEVEKLQFNISGDDFYILNLCEDDYDVLVDDVFKTKLLKDEEGKYYLENTIAIEEPQNYKVKIEIKDNSKTIYNEEFVLFDFNHDILVFDGDGNYYKDHNSKLDDSKTYSILIDSDFDLEADEENIHEYFDGYVHLITNITKDSNFKADDGDLFQFSLNFKEHIKTPNWLNNLELYAQSDYLEPDEPIKYSLRYNKLAVSARQTDQLIDIEQDASIVRWSYSGGVVYDLEDIENFDYDMDLTSDILINRKNTLKIKVNDIVFSKQLHVTLLEKTEKPKYRTFLKDIDDNIQYLKETNKLNYNDIKNNQIIITSFHEDFINDPELKKQILRDKATIFDSFEVNKFFTLTNYPYYAEDISSCRKIYDDVRWNTFCSIAINGIVRSYDKDSSTAILHSNNSLSNLTLITLDRSYKLNSHKADIKQNKISIPHEILGFCLVEDGNYKGSYFTDETLDIDMIFNDVEVLKFLRASCYPFGEYFNDIAYETNRAQMQKARTEKKRLKRTLRACIKNDPYIFLKAFMDDQLTIDDTTIILNFNHSKTIVEQILFTIEFDQEKAIEIIHKIILNRWQEKMIQIPLFLIFTLNSAKNDRYYKIFLDELPEDINEPSDVDEEFIERMIKALLSDHKIDRYEKINIKTITQLENKDFYIYKALNRLAEGDVVVDGEDKVE